MRGQSRSPRAWVLIFQSSGPIIDGDTEPEKRPPRVWDLPQGFPNGCWFCLAIRDWLIIESSEVIGEETATGEARWLGSAIDEG